MAGPPRMKHWLNWRDVSGKPGTIDELKTLIRNILGLLFFLRVPN